MTVIKQTALLTQQLADRWGISPQTLENWRSQGKGPKYVKLGAGRSSPIVYRLSDVEKYERKHLKGEANETILYVPRKK